LTPSIHVLNIFRKMERERFRSLQMEFSAIARQWANTNDLGQRRILLLQADRIISEANRLVAGFRLRVENMKLGFPPDSRRTKVRDKSAD